MLTNRQLMLSCLGTHISVPVCCCTYRGHLSFFSSLLFLCLLFFFLLLFFLFIFPPPPCSISFMSIHYFFFLCSNLQRQIYIFHSVMMNKSQLKSRRGGKPTVWKRGTCLYIFQERTVCEFQSVHPCVFVCAGISVHLSLASLSD